MLRIDNLTYRIGPRVLLDQAKAAIDPGHKVGMVGRNGAGKTTLLKLITGELQADGGGVATPDRWRVGVSTQEAPGGPRSLIDTVLAADSELAELTAAAETATDPHAIAEIQARLHDLGAHTARSRAARILAGLGFDEAAQQRPCGDFSGGWRMRVALAALLFTEPDLLLLDEPTNHLDLEACLWLEDYLRRYAGTVVLVSHDRDLLNRVVGEILHLEHGKLTLYRGNYDRFERTRRIQLEQNEKARAKQDLQRAHIKKFVDRFRYKATKAKQAQSRLKMLARMQPIPEPQDEAVVTFAFPDPGPLAPPLYATDDVAVGYDGTPVLSRLNLRLYGDDRIALLGANGNGKSTLIKLLAGRLEPLAGHVTKSAKLRVGYFAQHQAEELDLSASPVIALGRKRRHDLEPGLRSHLARFGFSQGRADTRIEDLSGGEKARLLFALMTCDKPHILLLDEPSNHLDVVSRQALIQAINGFAGAVIIVSHDPHIIELTADRFWLVEDGQVRAFDGDLEDYRSKVLSRGRGIKAREPATETAPGGRNKKQRRRAAAEKRQALAPLKRRLTRAEDKVHRLEAEKSGFLDALADPKLYQGDGGDRLMELRKRSAQLDKDLARAEATWAGLQEAWDRA